MLASAPGEQVSTLSGDFCRGNARLYLDLQDACDLGWRSELRPEMEDLGRRQARAHSSSRRVSEPCT